jgi:elongation factor G
MNINLNYEKDILEKKRNIGVTAHIDAGKTTLTEGILWYTGIIRQPGETHEGKSAMDFLDQEKQRGITITSASTNFNWKKFSINLIDTPGHIDFTAEVERSLRVLDGSVLVIDGQAGVEPQTITVWIQSSKYNIPRIIFINKMDKLGADFNFSVDSISKKLKCFPIVVQIPIFDDNKFIGIIDVLSKKAYKFSNFKKNNSPEDTQEFQIPSKYLNDLKKYYDEVINLVIENDNEALEEFEKNNFSLSFITLKRVIRKLVINYNTYNKVYCPIFCGSAKECIGINFLLDGVIDYLPSPLDVHHKIYKDDKKIDFSPNFKGTAGLCFKVVYNSFGKVTFVRIYSGKMEKGMKVYNSSNKDSKSIKIGRIVRVHADKHVNIDSFGTGDIAAIINLDGFKTGDTICDEYSNNEKIVLDPIKFVEPVFSLSIFPLKDQMRGISDALVKISDEDPTFKYSIDPSTNELIIHGMGELHLSIIVNRLENFGLKFTSEIPKVSFRERITKSIKKIYTRSKQTGGRGSYAKIEVSIEPSDKDFEFLDEVVSGDIKKSYINYVEKGFISQLSQGYLTNSKIIGAKITLFGGAMHSVDSSQEDFEIAARDLLRESLPELGIILMEPIMEIDLCIPQESYGSAIAYLNSKGGKNVSLEEDENTNSNNLLFSLRNLKMFKYQIPLWEIIGKISTDLLSICKGSSSYSMSLSHYQDVPINKVKKYLDSIKTFKKSI